MSMSEAAGLVEETHRLLEEARGIVDSGETRYPSGGLTGVLGLYEALCRALDDVDAERLRSLLGRISEQVARLTAIDADIERIRRLRNTLRAH